MKPSRFLLCAISFVPSVIGFCNYTAGIYSPITDLRTPTLLTLTHPITGVVDCVTDPISVSAWYTALVAGQTYPASPLPMVFTFGAAPTYYQYISFPGLYVTALKPGQLFSFTYLDIVAGPSLTAVYTYTGNVLSFHEIEFWTNGRLEVPITALTDPATTTSPNPTPPITPIIPTTPLPTTPRTSSSSAPSSVPVGAIVGGAVGGVLGLGVIAALAWFCVTKLKLERASAPTVPIEAPISPMVDKAPPAQVYGGGGYEQRGYETPGSRGLAYPDEIVSANLAERRY